MADTGAIRAKWNHPATRSAYGLAVDDLLSLCDALDEERASLARVEALCDEVEAPPKIVVNGESRAPSVRTAKVRAAIAGDKVKS